MTETRNDYGFPRFVFEHRTSGGDLMAIAQQAEAMIIAICGIPRQLTKLERAQAYAADVRARRGMVVRKGVYLDPIK